MNICRLAVPANLCEVAHPRALVTRDPFTDSKKNPLIRIPNWCVLLTGLLLAASHTGQAASVNLAWNANPESDVTGYILSYGTSPGVYSGSLTTGKVTSATVNGLEEGKTHYFSLRAVNSAGLQSAASAEVSLAIPATVTPSLPLLSRSGWTLVSASSQETTGENGRAVNAFDGNPNTIWHSQWSDPEAPPPHRLVIDLGAVRALQGFRYLPRQDGSPNGRIARYEFHISTDGVNWGNPVASGQFVNTASEKEVLFAAANGRFVRLTALSDFTGEGYCAVAELALIQASGTPETANQAPVAMNQSASTNEDVVLTLTLAATDADGQALSYRVVNPPAKGRLSGTAPALTYTPDANVNGSDSFTFLANDGLADSNVAVVSITIKPVNDAPVAANQSLVATVGTPLAITLTATDIDSSTLTYSLLSNPIKGALAGTPPNLTYTPLAGASGADSFAFRASDGTANSNTATVSINISASLIPAPIAVIPTTTWRLVSSSSEETTGEDGRAINAFDGNPATFWHSQWSPAEVPPPYEIRIDLGKTESIQGFRYLPRQDGKNYGNIGQYEFYTSTDGVNWGSAAASGVFANSSSEKEVLFSPRSARFIRLRAFNDVDGRPLCNVAELRLLQGTVVEVTPLPNTAPLAIGQSISTNEDQPLAIRLKATDADNDVLAYRIVEGPKMGTLSGTAPDLTYTPFPDANGADSFTFRANDSKVDSNTATISIAVRPVNDAPLADAQEVTTLEDRSVGIQLTGSDKDGDLLSFRVIRAPSKGKLSGTPPNLTYLPDRDFNGADSFDFVTHDGAVDSAAATVSIRITPVNDAPVAAARFVSTDADKPALIVLSATDKDGDALTYTIVNQPVKGVLSGTPPRVTYTPHPGASGSDMLSFRASDGVLFSNTATVSITLVPVVDPDANAAPEFQFSRIIRTQATVGEPYSSPSLSGTAIDPDGDSLSYSKSSGPSWLDVSADGSMSGTPTGESEGMNHFTVRATDSKGAYAEASLEIEVKSNGLPLPWELARLGNTNPLSEASGDASAIRLLGSGILGGTEDSGLLVYQTLSGDGDITVRIREIENADSGARLGLMIRESLAANSKHTFIGTDGRGYVRWVRRTKIGGGTSSSSVAVTSPLGLWLRLSRAGTTVSAFTSSDGTTWTRVGRLNVDLGATSYIGLTVHSGAADKLSAAVFENITLNP